MATTAGRRSWILLAGLGLAAAVNPTGCSSGDTVGSPALRAKILAEVLAAVGPEVVLPALDRFLVEADALEASVAQWQDATSNEDSEAEQAAAQDAWVRTFAVWTELEPLQLGPAGSSLTAIGGEDLRDEIYSWPTVSGCRVDQVTVDGDYLEADFFEASLVNAYGLDAAEHLLFFGLDNDCPGQVAINEDGTWDALGDDGVQQARAAYAGVVVADLIAQAEALEAAWSPDGGDFSGALALQTADTPYASEQEALNALYDALFYLETGTKDRKLDHLLGGQDCTEDTCPDDAEALTSGASLLAIEGNLVGFRTLFTGGEGSGLDDLLAELGHTELSEQIVTETDEAIALAGSMEGDLGAMVVDDPDAVQALHDAIKDICDLMKGDLATVLAVQIPAEAAGDND